MSTSDRTCSSCHTPLPAEARFCLSCGAPTPTGAAVDPVLVPGSDEAQLERLRRALEERYTIERPIGQGGMATVYLAEDLRHHRKVAVKAMRPELAASLGPDRFLREIQIAAQLHHPHILMLIDSGAAAGTLFFVMPFVEGESLRDRLARERELPVAEVIRILRDVADALAYAHQRGVVHRDIKPDNILMAGRHALVADFGVAKAVVQSTTRSSLTTAGVSLGTPSYMAPEQAMADPAADHRVDIYALGVVAYELLTGTPPFRAESPQAVLTAQVTEAPAPVEGRRPAIPPTLAALVMRCLEKHAADRFQSADELLGQLEAMATPSLGMTPTSARLAAPRPRRPWRAAAALGVVALALVTAVVYLTRGAGAPAPMEQHQVTFDGTVARAEISPDGKLLAYGARTGDTLALLVRDVAGGAPVRIGAVKMLFGARWSPDGATIYIASRDSMARFNFAVYPRLGGQPRNVLCSVYAAWSPDGRRLACWSQGQTAHIRFLDVGSGDTTSIPPPDSQAFKYGGDWSSRGRLALTIHQTTAPTYEVWTVDPARPTWRRLLSDSVELSEPRWAPAGDAVFFLRGGDLMRLRVRSDGTARGAPSVVQSGLEAGTFGVAGTGDIVYTKQRVHTNLWIASEHGRGSGRFDTRRLTEGTAQRSQAALSPDGSQVAWQEVQGGVGNIFVAPLTGGAPRQVTTDGRVVSAPAWSPRGEGLAFMVRDRGAQRVAVVAASGGVPQVYPRSEAGEQDIAWAPDDRILYQRPGNHNFNFLDPRSEAESALVRNPEAGWMFQARVSPDRRWVAVNWNRYNAGVWIVGTRDTTQRLLLERGRRGTIRPAGWTSDSRAVFVRRWAPDDLVLVPITGGTPLRTLPLPVPGADCAVRDEARGLLLACAQDDSVSDAWLLTRRDTRTPARTP